MRRKTHAGVSPPPAKAGGSPVVSVSTLSRVQRAASVNSRSGENTGVCFSFGLRELTFPARRFAITEDELPRTSTSVCLSAGAEAPRKAHGASRKPFRLGEPRTSVRGGTGVFVDSCTGGEAPSRRRPFRPPAKAGGSPGNDATRV